MHIQTKGLVLKETSAGDSNRCVMMLTDKLGIIKTFIKGAKSTRSRNSCVSQLFAYSDIVFYKGKSGYIVNETEVNEVFAGLGTDIIKLALAQYFCEIMLIMAPKEEPAEQYLKFLLNSLYYLEKEKIDKNLIKAVFEMRTCVMSGYMPDLIGCHSCADYTPGKMYFSFNDSFLLCNDCIHNKDRSNCIHLQNGVLEALRHIIYSPIEKLFAFRVSDKVNFDLSRITEKYLILNSYSEFKSLKFYNSLINIRF